MFFIMESLYLIIVVVISSFISDGARSVNLITDLDPNNNRVPDLGWKLEYEWKDCP